MSSLERDTSLNYTLIAICCGLFVFSLVIGIGLLTGRISFGRAFLLMSIAPLILAFCQFVGYFSNTREPRDYGLIMSGLGWLLAAVALWMQHSFFNTALLSGVAAPQIGVGPFTQAFAVLAILAVIVGGVLSFSHWRRLTQDD